MRTARLVAIVEKMAPSEARNLFDCALDPDACEARDSGLAAVDLAALGAGSMNGNVEGV